MSYYVLCNPIFSASNSLVNQTRLRAELSLIWWAVLFSLFLPIAIALYIPVPQGIFLEYQLHQLASVVNDLTDASEINKTDQDRARLNLTLYRAVVAGQIPDGLKEVEVCPF